MVTVARLENLRIKYGNRENICNNGNKKAIKRFMQNLSRNVKEDSKTFYSFVRRKQKKTDLDH